MKKGKSITTYVLLVIGIIVLVNFLADRFFLRLDFTADKRYTLSEATKNILRSMKEPVTVTAYISEELPPDFARLRRDFKDELTEYSNRSGGKVLFEFINPNKDEQTEQKTMQEGIQPVLINVREKDQMKQQKAYLGAVVHYGEKKEVIPFIQPGAAMEYSLSTSIKKMTIENKPKLGFIQGHGEPSPNTMMQVIQALSVLYDVEDVKLSDSAFDPGKYKTLVWVAPKDSIPAAQFAKLDYFLSSGRNIYIAMNRVEGNFQNASGSVINTGLERWLQEKGLRVNPDFVIDMSCGSVMVNQQQGGMTFQTNMQFPYLPLLTKFPESPVTKGLTSVMLQFASSMEYSGVNKDVTFTPIATTSDKAGTENAPLQFNIARNWQQKDFTRSKVVLAGVLSGRISGNANSRMLVVSDGDFPINGEGQQARQIPPDNLNFFVNGVDWLSDDTGLIDLRAKEVSSRPLDQMEDGKKAFIKYLNFLLPLILIVGYGFFRWQYRRNLRMKRMNENYI
ncbi:MAG: Gldg family protein [Bacteroidota bacterium]|jgi:gliding-associated putative ABC transporter substrate-binding component GldG